ncbi:MAG: hypothetical protein AAFX05_14035 [Planctomycetota bacterium]
MSFAKQACAGLLAGAIGAAAWAGVVMVTKYEFGILAWGIGVLVGFAVGATASAGQRSPVAAGVLASVLALATIFAGKGAAAYMLSNSAMTYAEASSEEMLISFVADEVLHEHAMAGRDYDGEEIGGFTKDDYPADVWGEAESRWAALPAAEKQTMRADLADGQQVAGGILFAAILVGSFGLIDVLWVGLAIGSAYKLGSSAPVEKQQFEEQMVYAGPAAAPQFKDDADAAPTATAGPSFFPPAPPNADADIPANPPLAQWADHYDGSEPRPGLTDVGGLDEDPQIHSDVPDLPDAHSDVPDLPDISESQQRRAA